MSRYPDDDEDVGSEFVDDDDDADDDDLMRCRGVSDDSKRCRISFTWSSYLITCDGLVSGKLMLFVAILMVVNRLNELRKIMEIYNIQPDLISVY